MDNSTKVSVNIGATNGAGAVVQEAMSQFGGLWKKIAEGGPAAVIGVAAVAAVAIAIGSSIKQAGDFQQQIVRLSTSAGESQANLKLVGDGVLQIARDTGTATQQLTDGMYQIESANYHGTAALGILKAAAQGAKTENASLAKVTDAVTSAMRDYYPHAQNAAEVTKLSADVTSKMVAAVGQGKATFETFTGSLHSVLPVASAAHIAMGDILGDLAAMTVHGISADQATQNLADVIRHMQNPTSVQAKELALLGMTTTQLAGDLKTKGLSGTLGEISDKIKNLMPPGSDKVVLNLKAALNGLSPAVRELGQHLFDGSMSAKEYAKAAAALDPISAKQAASFATLAGASHRIGDQQMSGAQVMQNYGQALAKATGDATGMNVALMLTGDNAAYTKGAIDAVSKAHADAKGNVKGWSEVQGEFNFKLSQLAEIGQTGAIALGTWLLPAATAVISGIIKLTQFSVDLGAIFSNIWKDISAAAKLALKVMGDAFNDVSGFMNKHKAVIEQIVGVLTVLFLPALVKLAVQAVVSAAVMTAQFAVMAAKAVVNGVVQTVQAAIAGAAWVLNAIKASIAWTIQFAIMIAKAIATAIVFVAQAIIGGYAWVFQATRASGAWLIAFPAMAKEGLITAGKFVVQAIVASGGWIAAAAKTAIAWVPVLMTMAGEAIATGSAMMAAGAEAAAAWLLGLGPIGWIIAAVITVAGLAFLVITHWKQVVSFFQGLGGIVLGAIGGFGSMLYNVGRDMISGLINGIKSMVGAAGNAVKGIGSDAVSGIKNLLGIHSPSTVFAEIGQNMGTGLIQGLQGIQAKANVAVTGLVTGSNMVNSNGGAASASSFTNNTNHSVNNANSTVSIGQLVIQAPNGATMQSIIASINQDSINTSRGLTPNQGRI